MGAAHTLKLSCCSHLMILAVLRRFRNRVLDQLAAGSYQPVLDEGVRQCLANLPWWVQGHQLAQQQQQQHRVRQQRLVRPAAGVQVERAAAATRLSRMKTITSGEHRRQARARVWLKRQRNLGGPGKLVR